MSDQDAFRQSLSDRAALVEAFLDAQLSIDARDHETERSERLLAAMRHAVLNGGKRLRPFLVLEVNALLGGSDNAVLGAAAGLELVHCYSLVHDDLPSMDDDDLRRGLPTVHRKFDEATAILAGDALLTMGFDLTISGSGGLTAEHRSELVLLLARAAGQGGMVGGQMFDLSFEHGDAASDRITTIHAMKTGALIRYACEAGAVAVGGTERARMRRFGEVIGLAFQLADDLLDVTADSAAMGKATGKDAAAGKQTLVGMHGIDWARDRLDAHVAEAEALLAPFGERASVLHGAARFIANRTN
ncbi:MAG: polyprenyl synthetase family protein [Roseitalea sp.]|jgi:farnesyl diphosphate synthase|nr:polyprenyl synthetase family protein [Roseitalea sp.]MBO6720903.1 polyprenyl synthetase family protein [Roseitalea sp.]MBO6743208.1 polyprenyl synthetase family protein [Roseitalea sp.]